MQRPKLPGAAFYLFLGASSISWGSTRVFMSAPGQQHEQPQTGNTTVIMPSGGVATVQMWLESTTSQAHLNGYHMVLPWNALLISGSGSVHYLDNPPTAGAGDSIYLDRTHPSWVFRNFPLSSISYQEITDGRFSLYYELFGSGLPINGAGIRYLGEFKLQASPGSAGRFHLPFRLFPAPSSRLIEPFGGVYPVEEWQTLTVIVNRQQAPYIVHGTGEIGQTRPHSGYIDPRRESNNGINLNQGIKTFTFLFSERVFSQLDSGPVGPADFEVVQTGDAPPPTVLEVDAANNPLITVTLNRILSLQEWTTIRALVQDEQGTAIESMGDLGAMDEPDRIDVGFLPCDVNQGGNVNPLDLLRFKQYVNGIAGPTRGILEDYADTDRSGAVNPLDLLRFKQLINGVSPPATQAWAGKTMNHEQP